MKFKETERYNKKFKETGYGDLTGKTYTTDISCSNKKLTSLEGAPPKVTGDFYCGHNKLSSLQYAPTEVMGDFYCGYNKLASLEGAPTKVMGTFNCGYNNLTSLEGAPTKVRGYFSCSNNNLTTLKGAPTEVENFNCSCNNLTTLKGAPTEAGTFNCRKNKLTSLEGAPTEVNGDFYCEENPNLYSLWPLKFCQISGEIVCDLRLKYQISLISECETEEEFNIRAFLGTDNDMIKSSLIKNFEYVADLVSTINTIF